MKKILLAIVPMMLIFASCTEDISQLNIETKKPAVVPAPTLFSNAVKTLAGTLASASVNTNVFRFTVSHWAMAVYQDEAQYDFSTRAIPQGWWTTMYRDVLADLNESARLIAADKTLTAGEQANKLAIIDIMSVYTYSTLVNTFGNVPYSESLNATNLFPKYDDAATISKDLLNRLNADIAKLNTASAGFASGEDLVYKGSVSKWVKFANTLRTVLYSSNPVWRSVIGFDRPTFVPFISTERTVLFSGQLFYQHIFNHQVEQRPLGLAGMPDWKDNAIATLLMKAFLMNY